MKKIKNFTVTAKAIKNKTSGLTKYGNYLNQKTHKNHVNTEIIPVHPKSGDLNKFIKKASLEALEADLNNQTKKKGGSPIQSYAVSYNFILPKQSIRPTEQQWRAIANDIVKNLKQELDVNLKSDHVYMNIHDQENPHLNLLVSKCFDGKRCREVDQKKLLSSLKNTFNRAVLKHCDYDFNEYVPENIGYGKRASNPWALEFKKALNQFKRLSDYVDQNNQKRIQSTENRVIKTLSNIDYSAAEKAIEEALKSKNKGFLESVERIKQKIIRNKKID